MPDLGKTDMSFDPFLIHSICSLVGIGSPGSSFKVTNIVSFSFTLYLSSNGPTNDGAPVFSLLDDLSVLERYWFLRAGP